MVRLTSIARLSGSIYRFLKRLGIAQAFLGNPFEFCDIEFRWRSMVTTRIAMRTRLVPPERQEIAPADQENWSKNQVESTKQHEVPV